MRLIQFIKLKVAAMSKKVLTTIFDVILGFFMLCSFVCFAYFSAELVLFFLNFTSR